MTWRRWIDAFRRGRVPGQLVIQISDHCNAACPQCGMNRDQGFARRRLPLDRARRLIDAAARRGVVAVSFTGGEPCLHLNDLLAMIRHAGRAGIPFIRTGTNGFLFQGSHRPGFDDRLRRLAERLAETPLRNFWISLDSADEATHEALRGLPGVVRGIARALPIFHAAGLYPSVNLGLNRLLAGPAAIPRLPPPGRRPPEVVAAQTQAWTQGLERFFRRAVDLGFTIANLCYPMGHDGGAMAPGEGAVYRATSREELVQFDPAEKAVLFAGAATAVRRHRHRLRIFTPLCALHALERRQAGGQRSHACRGGRDFFFVDAAGDVFPCGYRGQERLGPLESLEPDPGVGAPSCDRCEWECFRDPSELGGPLLTLRRRPLDLLRGLGRDPAFLRLWAADLAYYRDCEGFDGRRALDPARLGRWAS